MRIKQNFKTWTPTKKQKYCLAYIGGYSYVLLVSPGPVLLESSFIENLRTSFAHNWLAALVCGLYGLLFYWFWTKVWSSRN